MTQIVRHKVTGRFGRIATPNRARGEVCTGHHFWIHYTDRPWHDFQHCWVKFLVFRVKAGRRVIE